MIFYRDKACYFANSAIANKIIKKHRGHLKYAIARYIAGNSAQFFPWPYYSLTGLITKSFCGMLF
jgi:hypothetical protein